jgi:hypothetical protein
MEVNAFSIVDPREAYAPLSFHYTTLLPLLSSQLAPERASSGAQFRRLTRTDELKCLPALP